MQRAVPSFVVVFCCYNLYATASDSPRSSLRRLDIGADFDSLYADVDSSYGDDGSSYSDGSDDIGPKTIGMEAKPSCSLWERLWNNCPSSAPSATATPSSAPTPSPTFSPSNLPTISPTFEPTMLPGTIAVCNNEQRDCKWVNDGACDDGGEGSSYSECSLGSDCGDCGIRFVTPAPTSAPTPPTSAPTAVPTMILNHRDCWSKRTVYRHWKNSSNERIQAYLVARHGETRSDCAGRKKCSCWEGSWSCTPSTPLTPSTVSTPSKEEADARRSLRKRRQLQQQQGGSIGANATSTVCHNGGDGVSTCGYPNDGDCDDGGEGSDYSHCSFGHDCDDCGERNSGNPNQTSTPTPTELPTASPTASPTPSPEPIGECVLRREWGELTSDEHGYDEKMLFIDAWLWVAENCVEPAVEPAQSASVEPVCGYYRGTNEPWIFEKFLSDHITYDRFHAHTNAKFLPWHRVYLAELESRLQLFHPCVSIPYWDWTQDSGHEGSSHVFDQAYLGDADSIGQMFRTDLDKRSYSQALPLTWPTFGRIGGLNEAQWSFADRSSLDVIMAAKDYSEFRPLLEGTPHAAPHVYIAGLMSTMMAPSDPFFWLHHAMVDKVWDDWQRLPRRVGRGRNAQWEDEALMQSYSSNEEAVLSPQWPNTVVRDAFDLRRQMGSCYSPLPRDNAKGMSAEEKQQNCKRTKLQWSDLIRKEDKTKVSANVSTDSQQPQKHTSSSSSSSSMSDQRDDVSVTGLGEWALRTGWTLEQFKKADEDLHRNC